MNVQADIAKVYQSHPKLPENLKNASAVCILCAHNCGISLDIEDNKIVGVKGDDTNPATKGYICNKAFALSQYVDNANRVKNPLKKQPDGTFQPISWDTAIKEIAEKLNHIRYTYSPHAIGFAGLGGQGSHISGLGALPLIYGIGAKMLFTALGQEKTQHAMIDRRLIKATHDIYLAPDKEHADYVILLGHNPLISNMGTNTKDHLSDLAKDPTRKLVVVDPRITETSRRANRHLRIKPGKDIYFLMAMAAVIAQEDLTDSHFIKTKVNGYEELVKTLLKIDVAEMASRCMLDENEIRITAREYAKAKRAVLAIDLGIEHSVFNTLTSYLNRVLSVMTGNYGRKGGNIFVQMFGPKMPIFKNTSKANVSNIEGIRLFIPVPQMPPAILAEEVLSDHPKRLRAMIFDGANAAATYPDSQALAQAFERLELIVVIDPVMSETALMADYVLPPPVSYEKWDYSIFPKQMITPQVRPPRLNTNFNTLPEPEIYFRLTRAMGVVTKAPAILHRLAKNALNPSGVGAAAYLAALNSLSALKGGGLEAIGARSMLWLYETLGALLPSPTLSYIWLLTVGYAGTRRGQIIAALPELKRVKNPLKLANILFEKILQSPNGAHIGDYDLDKSLEDNCRYWDGRIRIHQQDFVRDLEQLIIRDTDPDDPEYPFILNGGLRTGFTANTIMQNPMWRKGKGTHAALYISPEDAEKLELSADDQVKLSTRRGSVIVPVKIDANTMAGHLSLPNMLSQFYPDPVTGELKQTGIRINDLVDAQDRDPYTGCPHIKRLRTRIDKVSEVNSLTSLA